MIISNKVYKGMVLLLFLFVFSYLFIRLFYNELMGDEIFTLVFYVYRGDYWGDTMFWDANNHLLNSFICHHLYPLFKNNFELYRLPNLGAFILYFIAIIRLTNKFQNNILKILMLLTFCTIPFMIECFAYCRGYGLSIAFFTWALVHFLKYLEKNKIPNIIYTYIFLFLTVAANLTFIITSLLIVFAFIIHHLFSFTKEQWQKVLFAFIVHILFIWALTPLIEFSFGLKERGALYIGGSAGLWAITGNMLTHSILYTKYSMNFIQYIYLVIFGFMLYLFLRNLRSEKQNTVNKPYTLYLFLFFGTLISIIGMSEILIVNYPVDRAAYVLVILFLLLIFHLLDQLKAGKYLQYLLLVFPLLFCFHLSIHSSNLVLGDRLSPTLFRTVKNYLKPGQSMMYDSMLRWNWMLYEANEEEKSTVATSFDTYQVNTDVVIVKKDDIKNSAILTHYKQIASDEVNEIYALARKKPLIKKEKYHSKTTSFPTENKEFYGTLEYDSLQLFKHKNIEISVQGHLKTVENQNRLLLVVQTIDSLGQSKKLINYEFENIFLGVPIDNGFQHNFSLGKIAEDETKVIIYIWNQKLQPLKLSEFSFKIFEVRNDEK